MPFPWLIAIGVGVAIGGAKIIYDKLTEDSSHSSGSSCENNSLETERENTQKLIKTIKEKFRNQFGITIEIQATELKVLENPLFESARQEIKQLDSLLESLQAQQSKNEINLVHLTHMNP